MKSIKYNSTVLLNYSLKGNNNLFESTFDKDPIKIIIGKSNMPQLIEASLYGLKCGDKKEYSYDSKEIFGKYDKDRVVTTRRDFLKNYKNAKPGDIIETIDNVIESPFVQRENPVRNTNRQEVAIKQKNSLLCSKCNGEIDAELKFCLLCGEY